MFEIDLGCYIVKSYIAKVLLDKALLKDDQKLVNLKSNINISIVLIV